MDTKSLTSVEIAGQSRNLYFTALAWIGLDLLILLPVAQWLNGSFPLFTFIWLLPPLITLLIFNDPGRIGIRRVAMFFNFTQAVVYLVFYSFLAVGTVGGWAAWRTKSIWPGLIAASLMNLILVLLVR